MVTGMAQVTQFELSISFVYQKFIIFPYLTIRNTCLAKIYIIIISPLWSIVFFTTNYSHPTYGWVLGHLPPGESHTHRQYGIWWSGGSITVLLKTAKVIPIYKQGHKDDVSNYRPISILPCFLLKSSR